MSNAKFNNKSASSKKPFCKVCQDAGKTEAEYTSHFVRSRPDMNGITKVTCPVLAATECRYCYKLGHTTKFCPVIEENTKRAKKQESLTIQSQKAYERASSRTVPEPVVEKKYAGAFAALADESDDEKPVPVMKATAAPVVDEFPALIGLKKATAPVAKSTVSWAAMAEKPAAPLLKPIAKNTPQIAPKSWADYSDSDSEAEYEDGPLPSTDSASQLFAPYRQYEADDDDW